MNWNWISYKKEKPKENKDYLCAYLMSDFGGGGYTIGRTVFRYCPDRWDSTAIMDLLFCFGLNALSIQR